MKRFLQILVALLPVVILYAQTYSEVGSTLGINSSYGDGTQGGGVSFADFNGDGSDDLTFTSAAGLPLYFYQNNGNGTFTALNLVTNTDETKEAIWADYDNDGDQDLFVTVFNGVNRLYQNDGNMGLTDVTVTAFGSLVSARNFGAAFGDYDRDGWLDIYVCRYVSSGIDINRLFRNNGDGTFMDVSSGTACNDGIKLSFDACFFDCNNDNWQEIYVANDRPNFLNGLYLNQLGTYSSDPGGSANIGIDAMNAGGADYDNDGDLDLYVTNTSAGNVFLENDGNGHFTDVTAATGTGVYQVSWASNFFDFDNDLDQDLYVSCLNFTSLDWANAFLVNEGDGTFSNSLGGSGGLGGIDTELSYGHAMGDLNNDGRLDIAVSQEETNNMIWQNAEAGTGNYLRIRLSGTTSNQDGIGARVELVVGNEQLTRFRHGSLGYLSQHSQSLHFGLGSNTLIDQINVYWPSGIVDNYTNLTTINQLIGLTEGETVLPLVLTDFKALARDKYNQLSWSTSQEVNTSHFSIERSKDGKAFTSIGRLSAVGNSQSEQIYEFLDDNISGESDYYRLKMVDLDGTFTYSHIQRVNRANSRKESKLSTLGANPTSHDAITIRLESDAPAGVYLLRLRNASGKLVRSIEVTANNQDQRQHVFSAGLTAGTYVLTVSGNGRLESHRVVVR